MNQPTPVSAVPIEGLNPPQREAVRHVEGPMLVLAGAGSGKTRVVTFRIARLILENGVPPGRILAVTFTNKAAKEMTSRIEELVGPRASGLWIGTFHSMCARLLRRHIDRLGYDRNFSVYDTDEQKALIKGLLKELELDSETWNPGKVQNKISNAKNHLLSPAKMAARASRPDDRTLAEVYVRYQEALKEANAVDFDDLLNLTVELLADHDDVRLQYQHQFEHVIVDEYQDTNEPQDVLTRVLAQPQNNLCVVGDDDQSIYRWRGAQFKNILNLPKVYKGLKVVRLEQNYRSTPNILEGAAAVISHNEDRHEKTLWTDRERGEPILLLSAETEEDEATRVVSLISEALNEGVSPEEVGVLYRTNAQSRVLEEALLRQNIQHRIVGGFAFYRRREVKVLLSYMKTLIRPGDDLSFLRLVNNPRRGIGQTTLRQLQAKAGDLRKSLFATARVACSYGEIGGAGARKLEALCEKLVGWSEDLENRSLAETLSSIVEETRYEEALEAEDKTKAEARIQNVGELISALLVAESQITFEMTRPWDAEPLSEGVEREATRAEKLEVFLERATLQSNRDDELSEEEAVTLMTLHAAKGLEFSRVFMTGMEEGLFPHENSMNLPEELEEERRLCYVGMTRAKDKLALSFAHNRRTWGRSAPGVPSRFLKEIPPELVKKTGLSARPGGSASGSTWSRGNSKIPSYAQFGKRRDPTPSAPPGRESGDTSHLSPAVKRRESRRTPAPDFLQPGQGVKHRTFGLGKVLLVEGEHPTWRVTVDFKVVGKKTLVQKYAKLEPV